MAAKDMFYIVQRIWSGNGRPEVFSHRPRTATTNVVVPHFGDKLEDMLTEINFHSSKNNQQHRLDLK
ncbi:hypothetical protein CLU79DRAFT_836592 [Phycomyces nitens]|nr:hypothetical protein CLU79DRAFT_836592 [Phycomyces nitens]